MWHQLLFQAHGTWIPRWQGDALLLAVFCCTVSCMCAGEWENWKVLADESTLCLEQSLSRGVIQYRHPSVVPHLENGVSLSPRRIGVCVCVCCARWECDADRPCFDEVVLWSWAGTQQCTRQACQRRPTAPFINYSKTLQQRSDLILLPHLALFISHMCTLYCRSLFANELTTCRWFKL